MNDRIRRTAIAAAAVALLAACSTSPSPAGHAPHAAGPSSSRSTVAYAACMRTHGVPTYPDPNSGGQLTKAGAQQFGVSSSQLQTAQHACQGLLPDTGGSFMQEFQQCVQGGVCPAALVQQALTVQRSFAQCMRTHGVPNWPDPTIGAGGAPYFNASGAGLSYQYTHSAAFNATVHQCSSQVGGSTGVPVLMG